MIKVLKNPYPRDVLQNSKHVLFVEGKNDESFDPVVLSEFLPAEINVKALEAASSIRNVAYALHHYHPSYYFLIDRDFHFSDLDVENHWKKFPSKETYNLLIWKRKEIENYFLDPQYLANSEYCKVPSEVLEKKILQLAEKRLNIDAANHVIISVREKIKKSGINKLPHKDCFLDRESTRQGLLEELGKYIPLNDKLIKDDLSVDKITERFYETLKSMKDGPKLRFSKGDWLQKIEGSKILTNIVNSSYFKVLSLEKKFLQGKEKRKEVIRKLLKNNTLLQPEDFNALQNLINNKIKN